MAAPSASRSDDERPAREKLAIPHTVSSLAAMSSQSRLGAEHDLQPPHERADPRHVQAGSGDLQVVLQPVHEPRAVAALERQFLVVDDDGLHDGLRVPRLVRLRAAGRRCRVRAPRPESGGTVAALDGAFDRGRQPVSVQSPARKKSRTGVSAPGRGGWPGASENVARFSRTTVRPADASRAGSGNAAATSLRASAMSCLVGHRDHLVGPARTPATGATPRRRKCVPCRTPIGTCGPAVRQTPCRSPDGRTRG